ncbi:hypothetical protein COLO4_36845 [Corchorus olitorius]|uniref:Uncharacterized protein n=1 Tax=Corchorus olitorius TaxID=93759 RepID=A0A1R3G4W5_9ROSI|nr:hypothetical protein COLO4_36845 [Corchorus olitorius]
MSDRVWETEVSVQCVEKKKKNLVSGPELCWFSVCISRDGKKERSEMNCVRMEMRESVMPREKWREKNRVPRVWRWMTDVHEPLEIGLGIGSGWIEVE